MKRILISVAAFMLIAVAARAADTSFAGTWELDKDKSENLGRFAGNSQTWTITQDAKTLTVETKTSTDNGERTAKNTFNLDGTETTAEVNRGQTTGKNTMKAKWGEGNKTLETSTAFDGKRGDNEVKNTTKDKWELAEEGKVLKIARTREGGQGAGESKLVLKKK